MATEQNEDRDFVSILGEANNILRDLALAVLLESLYQKRFKGVLTRQEMCEFLLSGPFRKVLVIDHETSEAK